MRVSVVWRIVRQRLPQPLHLRGNPTVNTPLNGCTSVYKNKIECSISYVSKLFLLPFYLKSFHTSGIRLLSHITTLRLVSTLTPSLTQPVKFPG